MKVDIENLWCIMLCFRELLIKGLLLIAGFVQLWPVDADFSQFIFLLKNYG